MSRGFQRFIVSGHLGDAPKVKAPQHGGLVAEFSIAVTEVYKDRDGGNTAEHTEWIRCKAFGRNAEIAQQFLNKGSLVGVEGKIHTEKWTASDSSTRYSQWLYVDQRGLHLMGSNEHERTRREHSSTKPGQPTEPQAPAEDFADDDIPW